MEGLAKRLDGITKERQFQASAQEFPQSSGREGGGKGGGRGRVGFEDRMMGWAEACRYLTCEEA